MSEYFKAAARCDITVVRKAPVHIDERDIIAEEIKARQFDTLAQQAEFEESQRNEASKEGMRQKENEERLRTVRLESKRKEALAKREVERQVRDEQVRRHQDEVEYRRLTAVDEKRRALAAEDTEAAATVQRKQFEAYQRRLKKAAPKSVEEQADELPEDPSELSYMERMQMEKERMGRMAKLYDGNNSIKALYKTVELPPLQSPTQLQLDITRRRGEEAARLQQARDALLREEREDEEQRLAWRKLAVHARRKSLEQWLAQQHEEEVAAERARQADAQRESRRPEIHPVDVMHRQVQALLLADREAHGALEDNLRAGFSYLDRLEEFMEVERDAWREQYQEQCEEACANGA